MEAGGGIWMCGDASDEVWYEGDEELSVSADYVVKDFLEPGVSRIHGNGGGGERVVQAAYLYLPECGGVWQAGGPRCICAKPRKVSRSYRFAIQLIYRNWADSLLTPSFACCTQRSSV